MHWIGTGVAVERSIGPRSFTDADNTASLHVAIVNQTLAERFWPGVDPIGKRFRTGETGDTLWQVVGIAQNGKYGMLAEDPQPFFYLPLTQHFEHMRALQIRTSVPPESLMLPVQQAVKELEPGLPIFSLRTMADSLSGANGFMVFHIAARWRHTLEVWAWCWPLWACMEWWHLLRASTPGDLESGCPSEPLGNRF